MKSYFVSKTIKNPGVLHLFLMDLWLIVVEYGVVDDVYLLILNMQTTFILGKKLYYVSKTIKNQGVLHLFLMDLWLIVVDYGVVDEVFLLILN